MEDKIKLYMEKLDLTEEEAKNLIDEDKKVDRMTSMKEINSDLTDEQKAVIKKVKNTGVKTTTTKQRTPRKKVVNEDKKNIISSFLKALPTSATDIEIINDEREFTFVDKGVKYKIVLSVPHK